MPCFSWIGIFEASDFSIGLFSLVLVKPRGIANALLHYSKDDE